jgi:hypothetical protein
MIANIDMVWSVVGKVYVFAAAGTALVSAILCVLDRFVVMEPVVADITKAILILIPHRRLNL